MGALKAQSTEAGISAGFASRVIDSLSAFVGVLTLDGTLIEVNHPPLQAANVVVEDALGKRFDEEYWWSYSPLVQELMREAIRRAGKGDAVRFDVDVRLPDERLIPVDFRILPMRNDSEPLRTLWPPRLSSPSGSKLRMNYGEANRDSVSSSIRTLLVSHSLTGSAGSAKATTSFCVLSDTLAKNCWQASSAGIG